MIYSPYFIASIFIATMVLFFGIGPKFLWPANELEKKLTLYRNYRPAELVDPEQAPREIRAIVVQGYNYLLETRKNLPQYAGDWVSCRNCHFAAGNTFGGANNGISLVGVSKKYPIHEEGNKVVTLEDRINGCFLRSMNGKALPVDSKEMKAMVAYLNWISLPVEKYPANWLGLPRIRSQHVPDPNNGQKLFAQYCAACHGKDGEGQMREEGLSYPPLWGPHSFNSAAGMNKFPVLVSFIYCNMPYRDPFLTLEEAMDIAAFVIEQPRPKLIEKTGS